MMTSYYSPLEVFHHRDQIDAIRGGQRPALLHVHLVLTNRCNQNCRFCAYRSAGYSSSADFHAGDEIPHSKAVEIITDCQELGVKAIEITGGGEPTVHKGFSALCRQIHHHGIDYSVVTNGSQLNEDAMSALADAQWVRFSIDAGCAATYALIRRAKSDGFDRVRRNLRNLIANRNGHDLVVGVSFVVTEDNWREVAQAAANARDDGADNFRISAVFQNKGAEYFRGFYDAASNLCREAKALQTDCFTVFNLFGDRVGDLVRQSPSESTCHLQQLVTFIGADLGVYRCCVLAYNPAGRLGSLKDQSFREMWLSGETACQLRALDARQCPRCMFGVKNQTIAYAIEERPVHVNFL